MLATSFTEQRCKIKLGIKRVDAFEQHSLSNEMTELGQCDCDSDNYIPVVYVFLRGAGAALTLPVVSTGGGMSILPDDITCTCGEGSTMSVNSAYVGGGISNMSVNSAHVGGGISTMSVNSAYVGGEISNMSVNSAYAGGGVSHLSGDDAMFRKAAVGGFPSQIPAWKNNYN